jgi:1-deoxy-D-xylulose-5-phosphate reductoisomerase
MTDDVRQVAVLGSTGSIGCNTLEVVAASQGRLHVVGLAAHRRLRSLQQQAQTHHPRWIVAADARLAAEHPWKLPPQTTILTGPEGLEQLASSPGVDIVVAAIVGSAGLRSTWAALEAGKRVALANKETLVLAGSLVMDLARRRQAEILPVDSEHSAVFQALRAGTRREIRRVILTASGGPFRTYSAERLEQVTVDEALAHPTWDMGPKITVDSATMMNKALEIIEARWLFGLEPSQISVVVHPQSTVHSLVEFVDGSVFAQLSPPDMRLPIQYAMTYPERWEGPAECMDWTQAWSLDFEPPDEERFPAIRLGYEVAGAGGTTGAVLNAANEAAVAQFLAGKLPFCRIVPACRAILDCHNYDPAPTLDELIRCDQWAREEVNRWVST